MNKEEKKSCHSTYQLKKKNSNNNTVIHTVYGSVCAFIAMGTYSMQHKCCLPLMCVIVMRFFFSSHFEVLSRFSEARHWHKETRTNKNIHTLCPVNRIRIKQTRKLIFFFCRFCTLCRPLTPHHTCDKINDFICISTNFYTQRQKKLIRVKRCH